MAQIIAVSGYKDSGKTTLCRKLLEELRSLGVRVGYIKRTAESVLPGGAEVDTRVARDIGVDSVLWGSDGLLLESALGAGTAPEVIASRYFPDAEIILLEGGKNLTLPKIWVCSEKDGEEINFPGIFVRYDRRLTGGREGLFGVGSEGEIASLLESLVRGKGWRSASVYIGDRLLPMKDFVADFVRGGTLGMIGSLKGAELDSDVRIFIKHDSAERQKEEK